MTGPTEREVPEAILASAEEITAFSIDSQSDPFLPTSWAEKVIDPDVTVLVERFPGGQLTRGNLFELGDAARDGDLAARHQLVLATFMWGYGTRGGRSYANARKTLADPTLDGRLAATTEALVAGDLGTAYCAIDGLKGYGKDSLRSTCTSPPTGPLGPNPNPNPSRSFSTRSCGHRSPSSPTSSARTGRGKAGGGDR